MKNQRNYWIEVTMGDWGWTDKCGKDEPSRMCGLKAPNSTKYINFFNNIKKDDIIFTHLTQGLTKRKEWRSSIVGISEADGEYQLRGKTLMIPVKNCLELPVPIKFSSYRNMKNVFSPEFQRGISMTLQSYIIKISEEDAKILLSIFPENSSIAEKIFD